MPLSRRKSICINGNQLSNEEVLKQFAVLSENDNSIQTKIFRFLASWFDVNPTLTLQTSGSTGKPKEILVEKSRMVESAHMTGQYFNLKKGDTALLCLSHDFIAGKMMIVRAIELKLNLLISENFGYPLEGINQIVNFAAMVPLQIANSLKNDPAQFRFVEKLIIGGSGIYLDLESQLQGLKTQCWHTYAMTETLSHVALRKINGPDKSEWFQPLPGVSISLDERDCIVIDAPRLSSQKIVTNDIAILEGTRFKVLGRYDDVIISAGNKLHPALIEKKLEPIIQSPFFVFGEKHSEAGQSLVLCIESNESSFAVEYLKKQMGEILDKPEMPRRIAVIPKFSYIESGKIDRINTLNHDYNY